MFLDEIGDMPLALQAKLLRVLQDREVRAVGATQGTAVDLRIISATHRDLDVQMKAGRFREDLYYRLNVVSLVLPPLSERREDIVPLATHYLGATAGRYGKDVRAFAPEALQMLLAAPWPGNVRQLVNVIEQVVALCACSRNAIARSSTSCSSATSSSPRCSSPKRPETPEARTCRPVAQGRQGNSFPISLIFLSCRKASLAGDVSGTMPSRIFE